MNWWGRSKDQTGRQGHFSNMKISGYSDLVKVFGEPDTMDKFNSGKAYGAYWNLKILGVKYTIKIDSYSVIMKKMRKEISAIDVPSLDDKIVNEFSIVGNREISEKVIKPLLEMIFNNTYSSKSAKDIIEFVFENTIGD